MRPIRVPIDALRVGDNQLGRDTARYLSRVLRMTEGASFIAFDPEGRVEADAVLLRADKLEATARVGVLRPASVVPQRDVTIIQCVGKGGKLDSVVRDATELSATAILPAISAHSVAERASDAAFQRLRKVAAEASRQSGRGDILQLEPPAPLATILARFDSGRRIVLSPEGQPLRTSLSGLARTEAVVFLVGPEGGLAPAELESAVRLGFVATSLGAVILRTETAAAAVLGALLLLGGETMTTC